MASNLFQRMRDCLHRFDFHRLFVEELGWSQPASPQTAPMTIQGADYTRRQIAQLSGVVVFEITAADGQIPDVRTRAALHKDIAALHHENLLIFLDAHRTQSLLYWVKRAEGKNYPRSHLYVTGQSGDLLLSKLAGMVFDLGDFDETGQVPVFEVANRLRQALDVERVIKKFYAEFQEQLHAFLEAMQGIPDERDRRWYASVLLNRLMFVYFLQRKLFLDGGNERYLQDKLAESQQRGPDRYYRDFLRSLFFEGFAKPEPHRSAEARQLLGAIKYLNGGLFLHHPIEQRNPGIDIPDRAFASLFALFERYSWNLDDTPGGQDGEINPAVLGYIFEKYINQKAFGAYYTRPEITEYLCEKTIHQLILDSVNTPEVARRAPIPGVKLRAYETVGDLLLDLDAGLCKRLLFEILPRLSILDPACGSGAFLVAAMKTLIDVYAAVVGKIKFLNNAELSRWLADAERQHGSLNYFIKKIIITDNLYGVDLIEEATEIAKLRLFLALVASAETPEHLEPLPNVDFNILPGNSLVGLMRVDDGEFERRYAVKERPPVQQQLFRKTPREVQGNLFRKSYREILEEKNRLINNYRHAATYAEDLTALRDNIQAKKREAIETLDDILVEQMQELGIKYEEATWDESSRKLGKPKKRSLTHADLAALHPFHWGYEFDEIIHQRDGFDIILTNPPWEIFKPNAKEFFEEHSELVTKKIMTIKEFEEEQARLLRDGEVRQAWLEYLSSYPHVSAYFRAAPQFRNQISVVNGKRAGSDINLYKLFVEQCFNLLRKGGRCGIITPGGIYADLGAKQLRELLFSQAKIDTLFGFSNERYLFEGVHHSQKFCLFVFSKGDTSSEFRAAFRINPREAIRPEDLERFLNTPSEHITLNVPLIRKLSPESLSVMEFKNPQDVEIAEKMLHFPLLGEETQGGWKFTLTREFDISKGKLLHANPGRNRLPLLTGRMFNQFTLLKISPKFWIEESVGRKHLLKDAEDRKLKLDYQGYRWVHRRIARASDSRTFISTIVPPMVFTENNSTTIKVASSGMSYLDMLYLTAIANSFCLDWMLRLKVDDTLNMFYIYSLPVPRLTNGDPAFRPIIDRAARLICTTPEFDDLAREVGLTGHGDGVTGDAGRTSLRAELDGLVAHLYGLTEEEFAYILTTFPLVDQSVKEATLDTYRRFAPDPTDQQLAALIAQGESARLEFKAAAVCNPKTKSKDGTLRENILQAVAAFLNSPEGGALLIGVADDGTVIGLADDFAAVNPQRPGRDSYELFLRDLLGNQLGRQYANAYAISFHRPGGREVCRIRVQPADAPVYLNGDFYLRDGNKKSKLKAKEVTEYVKRRWK